MKARAEALAKAQFASKRDAHDCALMYIALKKKQLLLVSLWSVHSLHQTVDMRAANNGACLLEEQCSWQQMHADCNASSEALFDIVRSFFGSTAVVMKKSRQLFAHMIHLSINSYLAIRHTSFSKHEHLYLL